MSESQFGFIRPLKDGRVNYTAPPGSAHVGVLPVKGGAVYRVPLEDATLQVELGFAEGVTPDQAGQEGYYTLTQGDSRHGSDSLGWTKF